MRCVVHVKNKAWVAVLCPVRILAKLSRSELKISWYHFDTYFEIRCADSNKVTADYPKCYGRYLLLLAFLSRTLALVGQGVYGGVFYMSLCWGLNIVNENPGAVEFSDLRTLFKVHVSQVSPETWIKSSPPFSSPVCTEA